MKTPPFDNLTRLVMTLPTSHLAKYNPLTDRERWRRIQVAVAAYAYECMSDPIMSDGEFDKLCGEIDVTIDTGNRIMDKWFRAEFSPHTGLWVHRHPNKEGLHRIYLLRVKVRDNH